ncbi:MAG: type IV pili methyl-accepting chemotaxis transducer N-terminal domain-containing protein, partial [Magnetococcales bacterium]|nr:type IV pili methyl-accepting chemotaxis transducer N-terminal domain-containing protein [Magnetococcales bacterium]
MLSQKMAKEILIHAGEATAESRETLQGSVWAFGETLKALQQGGAAPGSLNRRESRPVPMAPPSGEVVELLREVGRIWQPLEKQLAELGGGETPARRAENARAGV